jgi:poly-gamma-glutamate synthesis protein (capsule biosynthesis protein)
VALAACGAPDVPVRQASLDNQPIAGAFSAPTSTAAAPTAIPVTPTLQPTATPAYLSVKDVPPLSLGTVFQPHDLQGLQLDPQRLRTIIATGDVIPARSVDIAIRKRNNNFLYPIEATKDILRNADLTVINLEAPLIRACPNSYPQFIFCGKVGFVQALQAAGVDIATLENNHMDNYGPDGITETIEHLDDAGIAWANRATPVISEVRGLQFGFLAFNSVKEKLDHQAMVREIKALRPQVDVLVVAVHWGEEYVVFPEPAPSTPWDDPLEIGHEIIDAGADLIIGNHAHWVQPVEIYQGKLITYGHGNFIFDQMFSSETRISVIGRYTFYDDALIGVEFIPTLIENYAQPVPLEGADAQAILKHMRVASERWQRIVAGEERRPFGQRAIQPAPKR